MKRTIVIIMVLLALTTGVFAEFNGNKEDLKWCKSLDCNQITYCANSENIVRWAPSRTKCLIDGEPLQEEPTNTVEVRTKSTFSISKAWAWFEQELIFKLKELFVSNDRYEDKIEQLEKKINWLEYRTNYNYGIIEHLD